MYKSIEGQMVEVKGVRRKTQLLDGLKNIRYWELKRKLIEKSGNNSVSHKHKEEIQIIFHKSMELLISSIPNNNNNRKLKCHVSRHAITTWFMIFHLCFLICEYEASSELI